MTAHWNSSAPPWCSMLFPRVQAGFYRGLWRTNTSTGACEGQTHLREHGSDGEDGAEGQNFGEHHPHPVHQQQVQVQLGFLWTGEKQHDQFVFGPNRFWFWPTTSLTGYCSEGAGVQVCLDSPGWRSAQRSTENTEKHSSETHNKPHRQWWRLLSVWRIHVWLIMMWNIDKILIHISQWSLMNHTNKQECVNEWFYTIFKVKDSNNKHIIFVIIHVNISQLMTLYL